MYYLTYGWFVFKIVNSNWYFVIYFGKLITSFEINSFLNKICNYIFSTSKDKDVVLEILGKKFEDIEVVAF